MNTLKIFKIKPAVHWQDLVGALLLLVSLNSHACFYRQCGGDPTIWSGNPTVHINNFNIPAGSSDDTDACNGMTHRNGMHGIFFDFAASTTNSDSNSMSDGSNRVVYMNHSEVAYAHAHLRYDTCIT